MKIKSISGLVFFVSDLEATRGFYESLGFRFGEQKQPDRLTAYINWFWIDFLKAHDFKATGNDSQFLYLNVEDVDQTYKELDKLGLKPTEPQAYPTGRRETMISDPDGYKLVFFQKK